MSVNSLMQKLNKHKCNLIGFYIIINLWVDYCRLLESAALLLITVYLWWIMWRVLEAWEFVRSFTARRIFMKRKKHEIWIGFTYQTLIGLSLRLPHVHWHVAYYQHTIRILFKRSRKAKNSKTNFARKVDCFKFESSIART